MTNKEAIRDAARRLGFDSVGFAAPDYGAEARRRLEVALDEGFHGDMAWMAENRARRGDPRALWPEARSVIVLGMSYAPPGDPLALLTSPDRGNISVYARFRDYHDHLKSRLRQLARWLTDTQGGSLKLFVDTAPVMEKPLAQQAGVGWQGKHTVLVSRRFGSWLFLGEIFTTLEIAPDAPEGDHCGTCRRCLDVCPTAAFPSPYRLDARRCIAYLTNEHKGHIPEEFRRPIGNRIFGCDDCLAVCPWNRFAAVAKEFQPWAELTAPRLVDLLRLDDPAFRRFFAGTPVKRLGRPRFLRNVLIALGNGGDRTAIPQIAAALGDESELVRAMAVWALRQLCEPSAFEALRQDHLPQEPCPAVTAEWG